MKQDLLELEKKAGYQFHDRRLLERAMTHKSYINEATTVFLYGSLKASER